MVFSFQSQPMAWTLNGSSASTQGGFLIIQQKSSKNFSFPVEKIVRMRSMCQFCWSWSQGFALVNITSFHHQSFCQLNMHISLYKISTDLWRQPSLARLSSAWSPQMEKKSSARKSQSRWGKRGEANARQQYFRSPTHRLGDQCLDFWLPNSFHTSMNYCPFWGNMAKCHLFE